MIKNFLLTLTIMFIFLGCAQKNSIDFNKNEHMKAFEDEDKYIFLAIDAHRKANYNEAHKIYEYLYKKSTKVQYLYEMLNMLLAAQDFDNLIERLTHYIKKRPNDIHLKRLLVVAYIKQNKIDLAISSALNALKISKETSEYEQIAALYINQKEYALAVKYLESAYSIEYDEKTLDRLATILFIYLDRKKDAIAYLETHSRLHGCSKLICSKLAAFYGEINDADGMLSIYKRLYERFKEDQFAKPIIKIYIYQKRYDKLITFLEKSRADDDYLLKMYVSQKSYNKVLKLSLELYEQTANVEYLGQHAIYSYESSKDKNNKKMLKYVINELKTVIKLKEESLYLNYLGYLLIEHNTDVKEGLNLIERALEIDPTSGYYLDSLAWGYYKLGKCKKASSTMKQVIKILGSEDSEVMAHLKAIKKCINR